MVAAALGIELVCSQRTSNIDADGAELVVAVIARTVSGAPVSVDLTNVGTAHDAETNDRGPADGPPDLVDAVIAVPREGRTDVDGNVVRAGGPLVLLAIDGDVVAAWLGAKLGGGEGAGVVHQDGAAFTMPIVLGTVGDT